MKINVIGKNGFKPTEAIKSYTEKKLEKVISFFEEGSISEIRVVTKVYPNKHKVETTIYASKQLIRGEASDSDMYAAIDLVIDKLVSQIRKNREKISLRLEKKGLSRIFKNDFDVEALDKEFKAKELIRRKEVSLTPMSEETALLELELSGHDFYIYLDEADEAIKVIYLREDGDYAVIKTK